MSWFAWLTSAGWLTTFAVAFGVRTRPFAIFVGIFLAIYSLGAAAYATKRPNPWPRTFGFHEVFHTLVIAAALVHFIAIGAVIANPVA